MLLELTSFMAFGAAIHSSDPLHPFTDIHDNKHRHPLYGNFGEQQYVNASVSHALQPFDHPLAHGSPLLIDVSQASLPLPYVSGIPPLTTHRIVE